MADAEKQYQLALQLRPDTPNLHLELGQVYAMTSRWPQAEEQFRAEAKLQPGNAEAAYRSDKPFCSRGSLATHEKNWNVLTACSPKCRKRSTPWESRCSGRRCSRRRKSMGNLLSIEKEGPLAAQAHFGLAGVYRKQGKTEEAERQIREFQKLQAAPAPGSDQ